MKAKKVLVIDDERIVLDSVKRILKAADFKVDVSTSGSEGLVRAIADDYDLVMTDLRMPDVSGMRVLRDIKRAKPGMPVIMITGYGSVQTAVQALKLGAADYIEKPFTPEELTAMVQGALAAATDLPLQEQGLVHHQEILCVLEQIASDQQLFYNIQMYGADALDDFNLTGSEKLAILTGDIQWIEKHTGPLTPRQRKWLEQRLAAEIW